MHSPSEQIYGLIGYPVEHSKSPAMHNAVFRYLGINAYYLLFEIDPERLENFLLKDSLVQDTRGRKLNSGDIAGFNVTIPHKIKVKEILQREFPVDKSNTAGSKLSQYVDLAGAVNTVKRCGKNLEYYNTDALGFEKSLVEDLKFDSNNKSVLVIGCGGAGRAVIAGLSRGKKRPAKIFAADLSSQALKMAEGHFRQFAEIRSIIEFIPAEKIPEVIKECRLLVDASGAGMDDRNAPAIEKKLLHKDLCVYDLVYHRQTQLIKDACSLGLPAQGGLGMLLYQAVAAFELWTDRVLSPAQIEVMRCALKQKGRQDDR